MTKRPNVLVVFTDQQRWDTCGCYGNPMDLTPRLDAMASRGVRFAHAFTCQPVCAPARASLQTGRWATNTGVWRNGLAIDTSLPTLAQAFNAGGYATGYIGKWHLSATRAAVPRELRTGYREWLASDVLEFTSHPYEGTLFDEDDQPVRFEGQYRVDFLADRAIDFMARHRGEPFFLMLSILEPHFQNDMKRFVAPDGYAERYADPWVPHDLRRHEGDWPGELPDYYGMVARIDECLGRMLDEAAKTDTLVCFVSDHGCHFRTRNDEYKRSCHESSIRIPLVFAGGGFEGGKELAELVSLLDLPPTLLDACGLTIPDTMEGRSLLSLARRSGATGRRDSHPAAADGRETVGPEETDRRDEVFVQISESQVARALRTPRWKYCAAAPDKHGWNDSRSDRYVDDCLFDLDEDPHEQQNLVGRDGYDSVLVGLRARLKARIKEAGEGDVEVAAR